MRFTPMWLTSSCYVNRIGFTLQGTRESGIVGRLTQIRLQLVGIA